MRSKIDIPRMKQMIEAGRSASEICDTFDVTHSAVSKLCRAHKILLPARHYRGKAVDGAPRPLAPAKAEPVPVRRLAVPFIPPATPTVLQPRTGSLIATGGRYADLARWAKEWGRTQRQALQEWHGLRLPVVKGGAI